MNYLGLPDAAPMSRWTFTYLGEPGRLRIKWDSDVTEPGLTLTVFDVRAQVKIRKRFAPERGSLTDVMPFLFRAPGMLTALAPYTTEYSDDDMSDYQALVCQILTGNPRAKTLPGGYKRPRWENEKFYSLPILLTEKSN